MFECRKLDDKILQVEHHFADGQKLITFGDGTTKAMHANGIQVYIFFKSVKC